MPNPCIGILTGGGDAPGLNAVIRAVTIKGISAGYDVLGFHDGWRGLLEKDFEMLNMERVEDIHTLGGTILGSSRTNPAKVENGVEIADRHLRETGVDYLIAAGGDDTLGVALDLYKAGMPVVGVPKTIDNDLRGTDYTFGFDTAINRVCDFIEMLKTTTQSHHRVMVAEIMGRHAGWMTLHGGMAGGAHVIVIPEKVVTVKDVCEPIIRRYKAGKTWAIVAVSEGAIVDGIMENIAHSSKLDAFGHVRLGTGRGVAEALADAIEDETGYETRSIVFGHLQRGGAPTAYDRVLGTRLGVHVVELIQAGKFGTMAAVRSGDMIAVPLEEAVGGLKTVPPDRYEVARLFFG